MENNETITNVCVYVGSEKTVLSLESSKTDVDEVIEKIKQCEDVSIGITLRTASLFFEILKSHEITLEKEKIQFHYVGGAVC